MPSRRMPISNNRQTRFLAVIWGWLPCGLVNIVIIWALSVAHPLQGAAIMLFFGLGTLPAMLLTGVLASQIKDLSRSSGVRSVAAITIIIFALWQLAPLFGNGHHSRHNDDAQASHLMETEIHTPSESSAQTTDEHGHSGDHRTASE